MKEFYIPHKPVVKQSAETTKLRIVYDASAKPRKTSPSLNECLEVGPVLQNMLWNVLIRCRLNPVALGDIKQAFLQIRINEDGRDSLRFHWIKDREILGTVILRFTCLMFGLSPSPFVLEGTTKHHLRWCKKEQPETVIELKQSMYVDDLIGGGGNTESANKFKENIVKIFNEAGFKLHKRHSSVAELEEEKDVSRIETDETYAKQQLSKGDAKSTILGISSNKQDDQLEVKFSQRQTEVTKRGVMQYLASVYDPTGLISPTLVRGKMIFRETCDLKIGWDTKLPDQLKRKWER